MPIAKQYMLVNINMKMQAAKREKLGNVFLAESTLEMERYLQFGEILEMGHMAKTKFPQTIIGDIALFHHTIEDDDWRLFKTGETGDQQRLVDCSGLNNNNEIFGFIRGSDLMPAKEYLFISIESVQTIKRKSGTYLQLPDDEIWDTPERILEILDDLEQEVAFLEPNIEATAYPDNFQKECDRRNDIISAINNIYKDKATLTKLMHTPKLAWSQVVAIHEETAEELNGIKSGDIIMSQLPLYPIDLFGTLQFFLCRKENVFCILTE